MGNMVFCLILEPSHFARKSQLPRVVGTVLTTKLHSQYFSMLSVSKDQSYYYSLFVETLQ